MKRWAVFVVFLYGGVLLALTMPVALATFYPSSKASDLAGLFLTWQYWLALGVMTLGQAVMLLVPVDVTFRRPTARRSVLWPVLASGLMMALLAAAGAGSLLEFVTQERATDIAFAGHVWRGIAIVLSVWLAWTLIFYRLSQSVPAMDVVTRQCRILLKGSILELLVAVPTHVIARYRDYCCAGFLTFLGIAFGLAVMIFSFGPGVFLLFVQRWKHLHPHLESEPGKA